MTARARGTLLGLITLIVLASPGRAATCSSSVFVEAPGYPTGVNSIALATADFNGDTFPDLASANDYYGFVSVILNDGAGAFGPPTITPVDNGLYSLAAADFDGDGNADLAVGSYGEVYILLGHGDGTFEPEVGYPVPSSYIRSIRTGNLDAGGSIDLVLASGDSSIFVLLGAGDGTFGSSASYPAGGPTRSIALGDFDGDDVTDVVAVEGVSVSLLLGFGNGAFAAPNAFVAGSDLGDIAAADFDDDGDLDVAVTSGLYVSVLKGNGSGSFGAALQYPAGDPARIVAGDFTGDGLVDLAVLGYWEAYYSPANSVSLLVGNGQGAFATTDSAYLSGYGGVALVSADFDGDARPDLAVSNPSTQTATVLLADGRGGFIAGRSIAAQVSSNTLAQGDYNGDGISDLAIAGSATVAVLLGDGHGGFATAFDERYDFSTEAVVAGDFTGDGVLDLLVLGYYSEVRFLKGVGDGTFESPTTVSISGYARRAAVGDFNEDGKLDFAVTHDCCSGQSIELSLGNGDGTFQPPTTLFAEENSFAILAQDLDGDGHLDLAATLPGASKAVVLLGLGDGTFQPASDYSTAENPLSIAAGDLTGDGPLDLIVANANSANVSLFPGSGDGTFGAAWTIAVGARPNFVTVGDFDGDGHTDFVTANDDNTVSLFPGHGGGKFGSPAEFPVGRQPQFISVGDFDRNGFPDLAVASGSDPSVIVLANSRLGVAPLPASGACLGSAGVIHAFASGYGPISYQWRKDGVDLSDGGNITGATTATLTIDPAGIADEGNYDVVVTDLCTTATSNATAFSVAAAPAQPLIAIDTTPAPGVDGIASVANAPGHTFVWSIGGDAGAVITAGQGTSQITFATPIPGLVTLDVTEYSSPGCGTAAAAQLVPVDFFDVPPAHPFHAHIVKVARAGVSAGCGSGNYCPDTPVTRAQMSVFLLKGLEGSDWIPPSTGSYFSDVPPGSFAAEWINYLASQGITGGCGGSLYCPDGSVTRAQMAVFILKTLGTDYPPYSPQIFDDVPQGSFAWDFIDEIYNRGITGGCSLNPKLYCPSGLVSRGQMSVFITRAFLEP